MAKKMIPVMPMTDEVAAIVAATEQELSAKLGHMVKVSVRVQPILDKVGARGFLKDVVKEMGLPSVKSLVTKSRKRELVVVRQVAQTLLYTYSSLGLKEVGRLFQQDHTTVLNSMSVTTDLLDAKNDQVTSIYQRLLNIVKNYASDNNAHSAGSAATVDGNTKASPAEPRCSRNTCVGVASPTAAYTDKIGHFWYQEISRSVPTKNPRLGAARHARSMR